MPSEVGVVWSAEWVAGPFYGRCTAAVALKVGLSQSPIAPPRASAPSQSQPRSAPSPPSAPPHLTQSKYAHHADTTRPASPGRPALLLLGRISRPPAPPARLGALPGKGPERRAGRRPARPLRLEAELARTGQGHGHTAQARRRHARESPPSKGDACAPGCFATPLSADPPPRPLAPSQDLRNHGESPHAPECGYAALAEDVAGFLEDKGLDDVTVVGHSMSVLTAAVASTSPPPEVAAARFRAPPRSFACGRADVCLVPSFFTTAGAARSRWLSRSGRTPPLSASAVRCDATRSCGPPHLARSC